MTTVTKKLANFIAETSYADLPAVVVNEAKLVLLDSVGCALAGLATERGRLSIELARHLGGRAESSIIGAGDLVSCTNAAFANGELINALDYDATLRPAIHVSPFVIPPAMALGESRAASGKDLVLATVLGHELTCRVASGLVAASHSSQPGDGQRGAPVHGYSANAFGSVASAGKMLNLNTDKMASALGIAGYNAPLQTGTQWQHSGTDSLMKYASAGWIAQAGVTAALLASMGYNGDQGVLDGENSFWKVAGAAGWRPEKVTENLGQQWHILNLSYKFFPCCGVILAPLRCFNAIMDDNRLLPEEIEQVRVLMHPLSELPLWQNREIDNEVQAQFSVPYVFGVAAHRLPLGIEWQDLAARRDPRIREFMTKVTASESPEYGRSERPTPEICRVEVVARGKTYSRQGPGDKGAKETAGSKEEALLEKFRHNTSNILPGPKIEEVAKTILNLEEVDDIGRLMKQLKVEG